MVNFDPPFEPEYIEPIDMALVEENISDNLDEMLEDDFSADLDYDVITQDDEFFYLVDALFSGKLKGNKLEITLNERTLPVFNKIRSVIVNQIMDSRDHAFWHNFYDREPDFDVPDE